MPAPRPNPNPDATVAAPAGVPRLDTATGTVTTPPGPPADAVPSVPARVGEFVVLGELGRGGMGVVYRAEDPALRREVALKVMLPRFAANPQAKARFVREARAQAKVEHDHVAVIHQVGEVEGVPFLAMPLLKGMTLADALKANPRPPLVEVVRIAREIAEGLAAAHAQGLVHRDIKPANVWLEGKKLRVKVLDFGLARTAADADAAVGGATEPDGDGPLTQAGAVVGTPAYMSPEQARGRPVDARTDLFSLGLVVYKMTTGGLPSPSPNTSADPPVSPAEKNPSVPPSLSALVMRLLARDPADRPASAEAVADDLRAVEAELSAAVRVIALGSAPPPIVVGPVGPDPFADLDATEAEPAADEAKPAGKRTGGKGTLIAAGFAVLLAAVAGVIVIKVTNKDGTVAEIRVPEGSKVEVNGKTVTPGPKATDPVKPTGPVPPTHTNSLGMEFVKVPKGTGWLGGGSGKQGETKVEFKEDFYLGTYEVTQGEWEAIMGKNPSLFKRGNASVTDIGDAELKRFPVENVSWEDCQLFIERLNAREKESGWVYRLPKEAEWEYACRGGPVDKLDSAFDFYFGKPTNTLLPEQANFGGVLKRTCKVGSYEPNVLGLNDMHGNIREWCDDTATAADGASLRVNRGGDWDDGSGHCRAALRGTRPPSFRTYDLGLRLARVPSAPAGK